jgi:hypothetical protein
VTDEEEDELNSSTDELENLTTEELENFSTEDESAIEELDGSFALELETRSNELDTPIDELENLAVEEELSPSGSVLLFPLSPPHAAKIRTTDTIPRNAIHCFRFIFYSLL